MTPKDKKKSIDDFIISFTTRHLEDQTSISDLLKVCRIVKTEKIEGEGPIWAFALYTAAFPSDELFGNFTVREYAKAVGKLGGISSQGVNLLKPDRHDTVINRENMKTQKCSLIPYNKMSQYSWCKICDLLQQPALLQSLTQKKSNFALG